MDTKKRNHRSPESKPTVDLEALCGVKADNEVGQELAANHDPQILCREIGKLRMELDSLKNSLKEREQVGCQSLRRSGQVWEFCASRHVYCPFLNVGGLTALIEDLGYFWGE